MARIIILVFSILIMANLEAQEIARVNGKVLTTEMYDQLAGSRKNKPYAQANPQERQVLTQILIEREVLYQEAVRQRLNKNPKYQNRLKNIEKAFYSEVLVKNILSKKQFSEKELRNIYSQASKQTLYEYKLQHILVRDQKKAGALIKKLQRGASFDKLAKKESVGRFSDKGGNLGWTKLNKLPVPLTQILPTINKGKINQAPIGSQLGWHIVKVLDKRKAKMPPFNQVRRQVENTAKKKFIQNYIEQKRQSAKIQISTN